MQYMQKVNEIVFTFNSNFLVLFSSATNFCSTSLSVHFKMKIFKRARLSYKQTPRKMLARFAPRALMRTRLSLGTARYTDYVSFGSSIFHVVEMNMIICCAQKLHKKKLVLFAVLRPVVHCDVTVRVEHALVLYTEQDARHYNLVCPQK